MIPQISREEFPYNDIDMTLRPSGFNLFLFFTAVMYLRQKQKKQNYTKYKKYIKSMVYTCSKSACSQITMCIFQDGGRRHVGFVIPPFWTTHDVPIAGVYVSCQWRNDQPKFVRNIAFYHFVIFSGK